MCSAKTWTFLLPCLRNSFFFSTCILLRREKECSTIASLGGGSSQVHLRWTCSHTDSWLCFSFFGVARNFWWNHPVMWAPGGLQEHSLEEHLSTLEALSRVHITSLVFFFPFCNLWKPLGGLFPCFLCMYLHCSLSSAVFLASTLPMLYAGRTHMPLLPFSSLQCSCSLHESCWEGKR